MKKIFLILLGLVSISIFSQVGVSDSTQTSVKDTNITKERYLGLNLITPISFIQNSKLNVFNNSLIYKVKKSNGYTYQFKINSYSYENNYNFNFTDTNNNEVERTYKYNFHKIDFRAGLGLYSKMGYGNIYINSNLIVGYAKGLHDINDFISEVNDSIGGGFSSISMPTSEVDYYCFGFDFAFGYEIDLGKHLMFGLEYTPEFNFYTISKEKYYTENYNKYDNNFLDSNFNMFSLNLLYHF